MVNVDLDMLPALDNFVTFGSEVFVQNPAYVEALVGMVEDIFTDPKNGGVDRIYGCKLAETVMLNLRGRIDQHIPKFVTLAMGIISSSEPKIKSYRIHVMEVIINAIYYNSRLALHILEVNGWTNKFFSNWFSSIDIFSRVHDKKLSIVAISSLLTLRSDEIPSSVQQGWPRLLQGIAKLFQTLPMAVKSKGLLPSMVFVTDREQIERKQRKKTVSRQAMTRMTMRRVLRNSKTTQVGPMTTMKSTVT